MRHGHAKGPRELVSSGEWTAAELPAETPAETPEETEETPAGTEG